MSAVVCSVGTTDPWNAAGLGLDAWVCARLGMRMVGVVAGVSAQDSGGIRAAGAIEADLIAAQFAVLAGAPIAAYRIGALLDAASVACVAAELARGRAPAIYDPVLSASAGGAFGDAATRRAIVGSLLPRVALVTPNLAEARLLADLAHAEPFAAAQALLGAGVAAVLVTGIASESDVADLYVDARGEETFAAPRLTNDVRGTGCMLACAIAAHVAGGASVREAIGRARAFVRERIADAEALGGMRIMRLSS